jgi:hypothetical protein
MGKKLVLLPQTIGPFGNPLVRAIAGYILRNADTVYSRDREGFEGAAAMLGANGGAGKLRFCYDLGFALEPLPRPVSTCWGYRLRGRAAPAGWD